MTPSSRDPGEFVPGAIVEVLADDPEEDLYRGERGTVLIQDALGDLHIRWHKGRIEVWKVSEAQAQLGIVTQP